MGGKTGQALIEELFGKEGADPLSVTHNPEASVDPRERTRPPTNAGLRPPDRPTRTMKGGGKTGDDLVRELFGGDTYIPTTEEKVAERDRAILARQRGEDPPEAEPPTRMLPENIYPRLDPLPLGKRNHLCPARSRGTSALSRRTVLPVSAGPPCPRRCSLGTCRACPSTSHQRTGSVWKAASRPRS